MSALRFTGAVRKLGINPCVDVPQRVVDRLLREAHQTRGPVPVRGSIDTTPIVTTVVKYQADWRLYVNIEMRRTSGIEVGDTVSVSLRFDPAPRVLPIPEQLRQALAADGRARSIWNQLPPSHRREFLLYLNSLKTDESLERNAKKVIRLLLERPRRRVG